MEREGQNRGTWRSIKKKLRGIWKGVNEVRKEESEILLSRRNLRRELLTPEDGVKDRSDYFRQLLNGDEERKRERLEMVKNKKVKEVNGWRKVEREDLVDALEKGRGQ